MHRLARLVTSPQKRRTSLLENREFVDQKAVQRLKAVHRWIEPHRDRLARKGSVVEAYRTYRVGNSGRTTDWPAAIEMAASVPSISEHLPNLLSKCVDSWRSTKRACVSSGNGAEYAGYSAPN